MIPKALTDSRKLQAVGRLDFQAALAYPWLLGLASNESHGIFEYDLDLAANVFYRHGQNVTTEVVGRWLQLYQDNGLLIRYADARGRQLCAWTKFRGWSDKRAATPKYELPPDTYDAGAEWNIPVGEMADAQDAEPARRAPRVVKPEAMEPSDDEREVIDFYVAVWQPPIRKPYTKANVEAVRRSLKHSYDVASCKLSIFLAKFGPHTWYREHNNTLEYLIRPGVVEKVMTSNRAFNVQAPHANAAALKHGMLGMLTALGFSPESGGTAGPPVDPNILRLRAQRQAASEANAER